MARFPLTVLQLLAVLFIGALATSAHASFTIAEWTFETSQPSGSTTGGIVFPETPIAPEIGAGALSILNNNTEINNVANPGGNGSTHSLLVRNWTGNVNGNYFEFEISTIGFSGIQLEWDQRGSNTGPRGFFVEYSTDGVNFNFGVDDLILITNVSWSTSAATNDSHFSHDLSTISDLDNQPTVYIRLQQGPFGSIIGGGVGSNGTANIDNFSISALTQTAAPSAPEPGTIFSVGGLLSLYACVLNYRRVTQVAQLGQRKKAQNAF